MFEVVGGALAKAIGGAAAARVRAYGEMVDLLWRAGRHEQALTLEEFWDRMRGDYRFSLLCGYVMGNFYKESHSADFRHVCDLHGKVRPSEAFGSEGDEDARLREISI